MQAASTEFVADGALDPRAALDVALPPTMPSLPSDPSRAPNPLPQSIGADASLRSLLRRDFEGVVHSEMPCAHAHAGRVSRRGRRIRLQHARRSPPGRPSPLETPWSKRSSRRRPTRRTRDGVTEWVGRRRRAQCQALAAGAAGFFSGKSLIDGSGAPPAVAGLRAVATLVAGLSAGSFLMTPVSSTQASAPDSAAGMSFLRGVNLDQKTAGGLGAWVANMALGLSESTAPASGAFTAAGSFLRTSSVPDFATEMSLTFLTPHACGRGRVRAGLRRRERDDHNPGVRTRTLAPRSEGDTDSEMTSVMRPSSAGTIPTFAEDVIGDNSPSPPPASMPSLSELGSPFDGTLPVPVLAVPVTPVPVSMPSLSETGSEGMPTALPPPESMTVVLSARDACQPQNARGSSCREGAALRALQRCACAYPLPQPLQINAHLLVSKRRRRRELEHELVTGGRHQLEFEHVDRMNSCRESRSG